MPKEDQECSTVVANSIVVGIGVRTGCLGGATIFEGVGPGDGLLKFAAHIVGDDCGLSAPLLTELLGGAVELADHGLVGPVALNHLLVHAVELHPCFLVAVVGEVVFEGLDGGDHCAGPFGWAGDLSPASCL